MKKIFFTLSFTLIFICFYTVSVAQANKKSPRYPKWIPGDGYWNVVSNINTPRVSTIYFYNNKEQLVYTEKMDNIVLKLNKRKVRMNLKKVLDQSLLAFNNNQRAAENEMLVMNLIKK